MLYIEDFKKAYLSAKSVAQCESKLKELEIKKSIVNGKYAQKRIDAKIDILKYQIGMMNGSQTQVENFIKNINDYCIRQVFYYRFLEGQSWQRVSMSYSEGCVSPDAVRKMVARYFETAGITKRHMNTEGDLCEK